MIKLFLLFLKFIKLILLSIFFGSLVFFATQLKVKNIECQNCSSSLIEELAVIKDQNLIWNNLQAQAAEIISKHPTTNLDSFSSASDGKITIKTSQTNIPLKVVSENQEKGRLGSRGFSPIIVTENEVNLEVIDQDLPTQEIEVSPELFFVLAENQEFAQAVFKFISDFHHFSNSESSWKLLHKQYLTTSWNNLNVILPLENPEQQVRKLQLIYPKITADSNLEQVQEVDLRFRLPVLRMRNST